MDEKVISASRTLYVVVALLFIGYGTIASNLLEPRRWRAEEVISIDESRVKVDALQLDMLNRSLSSLRQIALDLGLVQSPSVFFLESSDLIDQKKFELRVLQHWFAPYMKEQNQTLVRTTLEQTVLQLYGRSPLLSSPLVADVAEHIVSLSVEMRIHLLRSLVREQSLSRILAMRKRPKLVAVFRCRSPQVNEVVEIFAQRVLWIQDCDSIRSGTNEIVKSPAEHFVLKNATGAFVEIGHIELAVALKNGWVRGSVKLADLLSTPGRPFFQPQQKTWVASARAYRFKAPVDVVKFARI